MRTAIVLFSLALIAMDIHAQESFKSLSEFWSASSAQVSQRLRARPLDTERSLDRKVRAIMDELDRLNEMTTEVYWADGQGSSAHPRKGIGLDDRQLRRLVDTESDSSVDETIRFVLGHEQGHMAQFRYYKYGLDDPSKRRAIECQADILGGFSFLGTLFRTRRPPDALDLDSMGKRLLKLADKLGSPEWDDQTRHPRPEQRARCLSLGMLAQVQLADWQTYDRTRDPDVMDRIKSAERRFEDIYRPPENFFEWSNRMAKRIVRYGE